MIQISIEDDGPGMGTVDVKQMMRPFVKTKPEGLGLSLSLCHTIVEHHGGELRLESAGRQGLIVHFTLPVNKA